MPEHKTPDYTKRAEDILREMKKQGFPQFDGDAKEACEFIRERLDAFPEYTATVNRQQNAVATARFHMDAEAYRNTVESLDRSRRAVHETAINSVAILNRLSKGMGLAPFADIQPDQKDPSRPDRYAVADLAVQYTSQAFARGQGKDPYAYLEQAAGIAQPAKPDPALVAAIPKPPGYGEAQANQAPSADYGPSY